MKDKRADTETEISFAGEVPLIPNVRPVIILSGSDYDMGAYELQPAPDTCPQDITGDGAIDFADLLQILSTWGPCP